MVMVSMVKLPSASIAKWPVTSAAILCCSERIASTWSGGVRMRATQLAKSRRSRRAFAEEALNKGTVAVFQFHGVGGGHAINIDREEHRKLLSWLAAHKDKIWTETFCHVMQHVLRERQRPG